MLRKILLYSILLAAAVVLVLWRGGYLDQDRLREKAAEVHERADQEAGRAAEAATRSAREAIEKSTR